MAEKLTFNSHSDEYLLQNIIDNNNNSNKKINESADSSSQKEKKHRRSRHCEEGRKYKCENCQKSYLSQPALLNHMFNKHPEVIKENKITKRKRGRPKKFEIIQKIKEERNIKNYNSFFNNSKRCIYQNEFISKNYDNAVSIAFEIYKDYSPQKFFRFFKEPKENPILRNLLYKHDLFYPICDDIFTEYLMYIHTLTNESYFIFVLKFILLFREYINLKMKNEKKYFEKEYTSIENANYIPDFCNDFFSIYLSENYFGYNNNDIEELIELIQHFCRWLLVKNYSSIKLDLVS